MLYKSFCFLLSEGCCEEQYPERLGGKGKISKGFFRDKNKWHGVASNDDELQKALQELDNVI